MNYRKREGTENGHEKKIRLKKPKRKVENLQNIYVKGKDFICYNSQRNNVHM